MRMRVGRMRSRSRAIGIMLWMLIVWLFATDRR